MPGGSGVGLVPDARSNRRFSLPPDKPSPAVELAAGALLFSDDGVVTEGFVGGSGRVYLTPRVSVGPEISYVSGDNHSHVILTGNVTFDLVHPSGARPRVVTPFVTCLLYTSPSPRDS